MTVDDVADIAYDDAGGVRWAIVTRLLRPAEQAAPVLLAALAGHRLVTEEDALVAALVAGGGTIQRRAHDYGYDLARVPPEWAEAPAPRGFRLTNDLDAARLVDAHTAANPPGHPDHEPGLDHLDDLTAMIAGRVIGPLVPEASWQVDDDTEPCGAVLVVRPDARRRQPPRVGGGGVRPPAPPGARPRPRAAATRRGRRARRRLPHARPRRQRRQPGAGGVRGGRVRPPPLRHERRPSLTSRYPLRESPSNPRSTL